MRSQVNQRVLVLGAGTFGTSMSQLLAHNGHEITLWARDPFVCRSINQDRRNPKHLMNHSLAAGITAVQSIAEIDFDHLDAIILAVPTQAMREVVTGLRTLVPPGGLIISTAKGLEVGSLRLPLAIIGDTLGTNFEEQAVVLSGPSFAAEIMDNQPTCVALASFNQTSCLTAQRICHSPYFRAYTSTDPIGLEVAGALKNIIAIAAGASQGLGYQQNSLASLITRGLAEITRIGVALGANPLTFNGLGGVGDIFLSCSSSKSRNFTVGYQMGQGLRLKDILAAMPSVAEGVTTAIAARELSIKLGIDAPIIEQVYLVLHENLSIKDAMNHLLQRAPKPEITFP